MKARGSLFLSKLAFRLFRLDKRDFQKIWGLGRSSGGRSGNVSGRTRRTQIVKRPPFCIGGRQALAAVTPPTLGGVHGRVLFENDCNTTGSEIFNRNLIIIYNMSNISNHAALTYILRYCISSYHYIVHCT